DAVTMDTSANGYRLPTEAEWLAAADDGHTYSGSDDIEAVAWYDGNSGSRTHEVKTKAPNSAGIYDMSGNVWEWCWDADASSSNRVYRGGSWDYSASYCTIVSGRSDNSPHHRSNSGIGFRVVRKAPAP
ncbi:MAG: SUMF1/EgtB/PvdO family nonheme iron enzyme, partial [Treponema sp.]|nr:SUMF1/EgtB/PvdO family nonheme iron enzyme [Treponema sp.]